MFKTFLSVRCLMAFVSWGYFVPDETWQSVEIAHKLVFNQGYLTWEWEYGLRSYLHPIIFAIPFKLLQVLHLDFPYLIVVVPKLIQAVISAISDIFALEWFQTLFGSQHGSKATYCALYISNWFMLYASSRTVINTLETSLSTIALSLYAKNDKSYVSLIALSFMIRPTTAIFWVPMVLANCFLTSMKTFIFKMVPQALAVIVISVAIDSYLYGRLVIVPWNFLEINFIHDVSTQYGVHPWHWYLTNFFPALTLGFGLIPTMKGLAQGYKASKVIFFCLVWTISIYSCLGHKEHRFLMPIVPIIIAYQSLGFKDYSNHKLSLFCGLNVVLALYLSMVHQAAPNAVMQYLSTQKNIHGIIFLTPCHGTPFYSHLHQDVPMKFLECPPNFHYNDSNIDQSEAFFENPTKAIAELELKKFNFVVFYEKLLPLIQDQLSGHGFQLCKSFWHTHLPESKTSSYMFVYCRE